MSLQLTYYINGNDDFVIYLIVQSKFKTLKLVFLKVIDDVSCSLSHRVKLVSCRKSLCPQVWLWFGLKSIFFQRPDTNHFQIVRSENFHSMFGSPKHQKFHIKNVILIQSIISDIFEQLTQINSTMFKLIPFESTNFT